ncbi:MAG: AAA family ATPase [Deltaproteobacteria bacterium]|nr:AAA family ATPase [Deltaproteobacteria bacterium]
MTSALPRLLQLNELVAKKSIFLFGPRATGKSFLIRQQLSAAHLVDLLDADVFGRLARRPKLLGEEVREDQRVVVVDEVQKLPALLDEVHRLIESRGLRFVLTGSSVRKLMHGGANLLGGRAWRAALFPLCSREIPNFDLITYLNRGGLPSILLSEHAREELRSYTNLYLREEIKAEALVRKVDQFARFLDVVALGNGEELNFQGISSDTGIPASTVQNYLQILEDTLLGFALPPFGATKKRKAITRSKFFLFDVGVAGALASRGEVLPRSELFGRAFEHFILLELRAYLAYRRRDEPLQYWRSTSGFEVDIIVGNTLAIECKAADLVSERDLKGLKALGEEGLVKDFAIVSLDPQRRTVAGVKVYPWAQFLDDLWSDRLLG